MVTLADVTMTLKVAQVRLCHSRMLFVRAFLHKRQEMVFNAHERAFQFFKSAPKRGIYDNMMTAVDAIFVSTEFTRPTCRQSSSFIHFRKRAPADPQDRRTAKRCVSRTLRQSLPPALS